MKYRVLKIVVDTNDGDYEDHIVKLDGVCPDELQKFFDTLQHLPVTEDYYYYDGVKKSRGNKIFWNHDRVGKMLDYEDCALEVMTVSDQLFKEEGWSLEEVRQEGMITESEYKLLSKFLPMYINEGFGFHTIISVSIETHTLPVVDFEYKIKEV